MASPHRPFPPAVAWGGVRLDPAGPFKAMAGRTREDGVNRWYLFRRTFERGTDTELRIAADGLFTLYCNGAVVGRGPARHGWRTPKHLTFDLAPRLRDGTNVLGVLLHVPGVDTARYEAPKGATRLAFGDGALWTDGAAPTDGAWRSLKSDAWRPDTARANDALDFIEDVDARRLPQGWTEPGFDDAGWDDVVVLEVGGGAPDSDFGGMRHVRFPRLEPARVPPVAEAEVRPVRLVGVEARAEQPDLPLHKRLYAETSLKQGAAVEHAEALLAGGTTAVRTTEGTAAAAVLDLGRIHLGRPWLEVEAHGGEVVEIAVAESLPGEFGVGEGENRIRRRPLLGHDAHVMRWTCRPGRQRIERFSPAAVRYLELLVRNAPEGLKLLDAGSLEQRFPAEPRGSFSCSDPLLTRLWTVGRDTVGVCAQDGWIDCPSREQRQWLGDAAVEHLAGRVGFGPELNALNAKFLRDAAESARSDGLTQMFAPGDHGGDAVIIPDWTLMWIVNAGEHLRLTGDLDTLEAVFPAMAAALGWFENRLDSGGGLIADCPYWVFLDWAAFDRGGWSAPLNALAAGAFAAAADIAEALGAERWVRRFQRRAAQVREGLERHWREADGAYVDRVDPRTGGQAPRVSQHANAAMILWGGAPRDRWGRMLDRTADPARLRFTAAPPVAPGGEPFSEEDDVVLANTFFAAFVMEAFCRAGRADLAVDGMRRRYGPMLDAGATTLWESFGPTASLCHGFSAGPTWTLTTHVLGLQAAAPDYARIRFAPQPADLAWAEGVLPTTRGEIRASWRRVGDRLHGGVAGIDADLVELVAPDGLHWALDPA